MLRTLPFPYPPAPPDPPVAVATPAAVCSSPRAGATTPTRPPDRDRGDRDRAATDGAGRTEVVADRARRRPTRRPRTRRRPIAETTTTVPQDRTSSRTRWARPRCRARRPRVVVLDSSFLDAADRARAAADRGDGGSRRFGLPAYLGDATADIELVGLTTEPNLEQIAALQPDLILGAKVRHEALYDQLSQIAPTVFSESSGTDWTSQVRLTGEALNQADRGRGAARRVRRAGRGRRRGDRRRRQDRGHRPLHPRTEPSVRPDDLLRFGAHRRSASTSATRATTRRRHGADQLGADRHARHRRDLRHQPGRRERWRDRDRPGDRRVAVVDAARRAVGQRSSTSSTARG